MGGREREGGREKRGSFILWSLPKWPTQPELGRSNAGNHEVPLGLPHGFRGPRERLQQTTYMLVLSCWTAECTENEFLLLNYCPSYTIFYSERNGL